MLKWDAMPAVVDPAKDSSHGVPAGPQQRIKPEAAVFRNTVIFQALSHLILMTLSNCGAGEDSLKRESLGLQGDQTSQP